MPYLLTQKARLACVIPSAAPQVPVMKHSGRKTAAQLPELLTSCGLSIVFLKALPALQAGPTKTSYASPAIMTLRQSIPPLHGNREMLLAF
ncbi:hypothetical protein [Mesorhizobium sp. M1A.F.Ca.ET.072.01.1.1]|uniref:hypothetical protein n=1 Tax=Mesorhizobium sp. M1A.F.Ca.ET.072.01.1.1 TaxID=2496753 RepID=UPI000FEB92EC|nr:hypothetical protein [Mesorhizobium sp. M1A.F.Ca.ET.072.01.1.1]TIU95311.1 MAG: hypothetical protein E5W04_31155 [Mesorhizobium sp.]